MHGCRVGLIRPLFHYIILRKGREVKIQKITDQIRRDFTAIYECEHCGHTYKGTGYDDSYFHQTVIPAKKCPKCGKTADESYRALATKYPDGQEI